MWLGAYLELANLSMFLKLNYYQYFHLNEVVFLDILVLFFVFSHCDIADNYKWYFL